MNKKKVVTELNKIASRFDDDEAFDESEAVVRVMKRIATNEDDKEEEEQEKKDNQELESQYQEMVLTPKQQGMISLQPESGMGYQNVKVVLSNGESFKSVVLNGEILMVPNENKIMQGDIERIEVV
jgi:CO dehydrogenase/acetyl-CoA synthase beta subunit